MARIDNAAPRINDALWSCMLNDYVPDDDEEEFKKLVGFPIDQQASCMFSCNPTTQQIPKARIDPRDVRSRGGGSSKGFRLGGTPGIYSGAKSPGTPPVLWLALPSDTTLDDAANIDWPERQTWEQQLARAAKSKGDADVLIGPPSFGRGRSAQTRRSQSYRSLSKGGKSVGAESRSGAGGSRSSGSRSSAVPSKSNVSRADASIGDSFAESRTSRAESRSSRAESRAGSSARIAKKGRSLSRVGSRTSSRSDHQSKEENLVRTRSKSRQPASRNGNSEDADRHQLTTGPAWFGRKESRDESSYQRFESRPTVSAVQRGGGSRQSVNQLSEEREITRRPSETRTVERVLRSPSSNKRGTSLDTIPVEIGKRSISSKSSGLSNTLPMERGKRSSSSKNSRVPSTLPLERGKRSTSSKSSRLQETVPMERSKRSTSSKSSRLSDTMPMERSQRSISSKSSRVSDKLAKIKIPLMDRRSVPIIRKFDEEYS